MGFKKEDGYTLVTVLLVVLLLTILGGAYIFAMNFEVRQSFRHDDKFQAYYNARSGAEAGFKWAITNESDFFENGTAFLSGSIGSYSIGFTSSVLDEKDPINVSIEFIPGITGNDSVEIVSTGRVGEFEVRESARLILEDEIGETFPPLIPYTGEEEVPEQHDYDSIQAWTLGPNPGQSWVRATSNVINDRTDSAPDEDVTFIAPGAGNSLKLNQGDADYTAKTFYFEENAPDKKLDIYYPNRLSLTAEKIIFYTDINFIIDDETGKTGQLCLHQTGDEPTLFHFEYDVVINGVVHAPKGTYELPIGESICFPRTDGQRNPLDQWRREWY